jgi:maltooligosyltrehalose trehalohydrolase
LLSPFVAQLFMGEEYGEAAPFQFFSNHIDEEIAVATREGRRQEFAAFAQFGEEVPDPEDPQTFKRSKLTRRRDPEIAALYTRLIEARRRLPRGDAGDTAYDEEARWLRVRRGPYELVCNFSAEVLDLPSDAGKLELATADEAHLAEGYLRLPPMSGALIR